MTWSRLTTIFLSAVIAVAVIGYFVGLADGVPAPKGLHSHGLLDEIGQHHGGVGHGNLLGENSQPIVVPATDKVIPTIRYAEIPQTAMGPTAALQATLVELPIKPYDLFAEIQPSAADKEASSTLRASRRAFNGAPPVIPHDIQNTNDAACYACHAGGTQIADLKASVMSHQFLDNCTQCHAPPPPAPFQDVDARVETTFVGLPAPKSGERAFPGAPPTIPHSQWMREKCTACHGGPNGWAGMESTHPWRSNCTQCHAPSAELDQAIPVDGAVPMLPPLEVARQ